VTTYDATYRVTNTPTRTAAYNVTYRAVPAGVPGLAVRLGAALEKWGRDAARPTDPLAIDRELRRQDEIKTRMLMTERIGRHW
jgi:hypothetical protein